MCYDDLDSTEKADFDAQMRKFSPPPYCDDCGDEDAADSNDQWAFDGLDDEHECACDDHCPDCGEFGDMCNCFIDSAWGVYDEFDAIDDYDVPL